MSHKSVSEKGHTESTNEHINKCTQGNAPQQTFSSHPTILSSNQKDEHSIYDTYHRKNSPKAKFSKNCHKISAERAKTYTRQTGLDATTMAKSQRAAGQQRKQRTGTGHTKHTHYAIRIVGPPQPASHTQPGRPIRHTQVRRHTGPCTPSHKCG